MTHAQSADATPPGTPGVRRRTILTNAAWAAPVIATASAAPAAAASPEPTIEFNRPSYDLNACGDLSGVTVSGTTDGSTPLPAGTPIVVELPEGFTFADGSSSPLTVVTDGTGQATVPDITPPADPTSATMTATANGTVATAELVVTEVPTKTNEIYAGLIGYQPTQFQPLNTIGLPDGFEFSTLTATDGAVFATLADGSVHMIRESPVGVSSPTEHRTWHPTGLTGDVHDMVISSTTVTGASLVLQNGTLTSFIATPETGTPVAQPLPSPPGGAPVSVATIYGKGTFYVETADGRLFHTPITGTGRGTWTEVTGFPTPLVDWTVNQGNGTEQLFVIGEDGNLYGHNPGFPPTSLTNFRNAFATWVAPLQSFGHPHQAHDAGFNTGSAVFIDAEGNLFNAFRAQNVNFAGDLAGQMAGKEVLITREGGGGKTTRKIYVIDGGRLYQGDTAANIPLKDVTPPADLLGGATIVDVHQSNSYQTFAIASDGKVYVSSPETSTVSPPVTWTPATGLPENPLASPIIQDGHITYVLGQSQDCPV